MDRKTTTLCAMAALATVALASPTENTYHAVTNDWYNANFSNVLELAELRLAANANDLVGAYLKLSWDICFSDASTLSNSVTRVLDIGDTVQNAAFSNEFWRLRPMTVSFRDDILPMYTEEVRQQELVRSTQPHKPIPERKWLKLLWDENLW